MKLAFARKYRRFLRKTSGIFYQNPILTLGLALPFAVVPSYGLTGVAAVSLAMLVCFVPTVWIASLLGCKLERHWRAVLYPLISCLLLIPAKSLVAMISPSIFDTLGVYFSLVCVNSLLIYAVEKVQLQKPVKSRVFALKHWLGATLVILLCGIIRELLANGSLWGVVLFKNTPKLPIVQMALGGFFLLGFLAAFFRFIHRSILAFALKHEAAAEHQEPSSKKRGETLR